jgi:RNA recognition motif-containing protein
MALDPRSILYVNNVYVSVDELLDAFSRFGTIHSFKVVDDDGAYAFLSYTTSEEAAAAIREMNGTLLGGHRLEVRVKGPKRCDFFGTPTGCAKGESCRFAHVLGNDAPPLPEPPEMLIDAVEASDAVVDVEADCVTFPSIYPPASLDPDARLYVNHVVVSARTLLAAFSRFGKVIALKIADDGDYALLSYSTKEEAAAAIRDMHDALLGGRHLEVRTKAPKPCTFFGSPKGCLKGEDCRFAHILGGEAATQVVSAPAAVAAATESPATASEVADAGGSPETEDVLFPPPYPPKNFDPRAYLYVNHVVVSARTLLAAFSRFGKVIALKVADDGDYVLLCYATKEEAEAAIRGMNGARLGDRNLEVRIKEPKPCAYFFTPTGCIKGHACNFSHNLDEKAPPASLALTPEPARIAAPELPVAPESLKRVTSPVVATPKPAVRDPLPEKYPFGHDPLACLYVTHLSPSVDAATLRTTFEPYGTLIALKRAEDGNYGFVTFATKEEAGRALRKLNGTLIAGTGEKIEVRIKGAKKPCAFFNTPTGCTTGANCTFSHGGGGPMLDRPTGAVGATAAAAAASTVDALSARSSLPKLFISYAWGQKTEEGRYPKQEKVFRIAERLRSAGYTLWLDVEQMEDRASGDRGIGTDDAMVEGIVFSDLVIAFISRDYARSRACKVEANVADQRNKGILWVNVGESGWVPNSFSDADVRAEGWLATRVGQAIYYDARSPEGEVLCAEKLVKKLASSGPAVRTGAGAPAVASSTQEQHAAGGDRCCCAVS